MTFMSMIHTGVSRYTATIDPHISSTVDADEHGFRNLVNKSSCHDTQCAKALTVILTFFWGQIKLLSRIFSSAIDTMADVMSTKNPPPENDAPTNKKRSVSGEKKDAKNRRDGPTPTPPPPFVMRILRGNDTSRTGLTPQEEQYMQTYGRKEASKLRKLVASLTPLKEPRRLRVLRSGLPDKVKADIFRQLADCDNAKFEEWVERALKLPLVQLTPQPNENASNFIANARTIMEEEITGHIEAKREVLCMISNWINCGATSGFALGLEGEPGVGKTSFAKRALAKSMKRPFCFISLGGASDASGLLGHNFTYEGAVPGRLVECLTTAQTMDPIIFFDELDKISNTNKGDELVHALIHLTDPVQNSHIRDRYFHGINIDISKAVLVFSYNDASRVHPVLLDRIRRIRLNSPNRKERIDICNNHLIPRAIAPYPNHSIVIDAPTVEFIVDKNTTESGMRGVEKDLSQLISSYCLASTLGSGEVLGLDGKVSLDFSFARAILGEKVESKSSHLAMYM